MRKLLSVLTIPFSALAILSGAIGIPLLLMKPFFSLHIRPLQLCSQSGLTGSEIKAAFSDVMDYCLGLQSEFSAGILPFSPDGASHFADVRRLFLLDFQVFFLSLAVLVLIAVFCRSRKWRLCRIGGHSGAFWGCVGLLSLFLVIGVPVALDFNRAFVIFHSIFFPGKSNWLFYPDTDPVILIMPAVFFRNCAVFIALTLLVICAAVILWDRRRHRLQKKER